MEQTTTWCAILRVKKHLARTALTRQCNEQQTDGAHLAALVELQDGQTDPANVLLLNTKQQEPVRIVRQRNLQLQHHMNIYTCPMIYCARDLEILCK